MSLEARVTAILGSPKPGAQLEVRTSVAFAARFEAEASRSGLDVEVGARAPEAMFRVCPVCGAQNSNWVAACFNCQTELAAPPPAVVKPPVPRRALDPTRWLHIVSTPRTSRLPLIKLPLVQARFRPPPPAAISGSEGLGRFLAVFVEREPDRPHSAKRFDDRGVLGKFLSVFVERK